MTLVSDIGRPWQALVAGRIAEALTERPLRPLRIGLELVRGGTARPLTLRSGFKDGGWYSLAIPGVDDLPTPPAAEALDLRLSVTLADGRSRIITTAITGADLARVEREVRFGDRLFTTLALSGAPFGIDCLFDPAPVALQGVVLEDNDPLSPAVGAAVTAGALASQTDARGGFRLGPLPLTQSLEITVDHDGTETVFTHRLDFTQPLNRAEFSVST